MKSSEFITESKKCEYCSCDATNEFVWADGRASFPICSKHEDKARRTITSKNGKFAEIVGIQPL